MSRHRPQTLMTAKSAAQSKVAAMMHPVQTHTVPQPRTILAEPSPNTVFYCNVVLVAY